MVRFPVHIPDSLDALLRREILARALTEAGFPTKSETLATKASRGGWPPFHLYGRIPLYRWGSALEWAKSRLSGPFLSTSECAVHDPETASSQGRAKRAETGGVHGLREADGASDLRPSRRGRPQSNTDGIAEKADSRSIQVVERPAIAPKPADLNKRKKQPTGTETR